jgi:hypothetical protein
MLPAKHIAISNPPEAKEVVRPLLNGTHRRARQRVIRVAVQAASQTCHFRPVRIFASSRPKKSDSANLTTSDLDGRSPSLSRCASRYSSMNAIMLGFIRTSIVAERVSTMPRLYHSKSP